MLQLNIWDRKLSITVADSFKELAFILSYPVAL